MDQTLRMSIRIVILFRNDKPTLWVCVHSSASKPPIFQARHQVVCSFCHLWLGQTPPSMVSQQELSVGSCCQHLEYSARPALFSQYMLQGHLIVTTSSIFLLCPHQGGKWQNAAHISWSGHFVNLGCIFLVDDLVCIFVSSVFKLTLSALWGEKNS